MKEATRRPIEKSIEKAAALVTAAKAAKAKQGWISMKSNNDNWFSKSGWEIEHTDRDWEPEKQRTEKEVQRTDKKCSTRLCALSQALSMYSLGYENLVLAVAFLPTIAYNNGKILCTLFGSFIFVCLSWVFNIHRKKYIVLTLFHYCSMLQHNTVIFQKCDRNIYC